MSHIIIYFKRDGLVHLGCEGFESWISTEPVKADNNRRCSSYCIEDRFVKLSEPTVTKGG